MSDPFALLVDAANAKSDEEASTNVLESPSGRAASSRQVPGKSAEIDAAKPLTEAEILRGALHQESLEREAVERDIMQIHAAYGGIGAAGNPGGGMGRLQGTGTQEADYLHQLRLEALVQQRRQETLAQLAFTQEMDLNPQLFSFAQAEQLRQAALWRQEMMLQGAFTGSPHFAGGHPLTGLSERNVMRERELHEERLRKERYEQQQQLASLGYGAGRNPGLIAALANKGRPDSVVSHVMPATTPSSPAIKIAKAPQSEAVIKSEDERFMIIPCPARGLPPGHNAKTAYFKITTDVRHGTPLVCSYYACRNAGAQFNFCSTCNMPVSKWNFKKLHSHKQAAYLDAEYILAQLVERGVKEIVVPGSGGDQPPVRQTTVEARKFFDSRRDQWEKLLHSRPKSTVLIDDWVRQVLAVSDIDSEIPISRETSKNPLFAKSDIPTVRKLVKKRALPINGSKSKSPEKKSLPKKKKTEKPFAVSDTCNDAEPSSDRPNIMTSSEASTATTEAQLRKEDASTEELKTMTKKNDETVIRQSPSSGMMVPIIASHKISDGSLGSKEPPADRPAGEVETLPKEATVYDSDSGSSSSSDDSVDLRASKRGR